MLTLCEYKYSCTTFYQLILYKYLYQLNIKLIIISNLKSVHPSRGILHLCFCWKMKIAWINKEKESQDLEAISPTTSLPSKEKQIQLFHLQNLTYVCVADKLVMSQMSKQC